MFLHTLILRIHVGCNFKFQFQTVSIPAYNEAGDFILAGRRNLKIDRKTNDPKQMKIDPLLFVRTDFPSLLHIVFSIVKTTSIDNDGRG